MEAVIKARHILDLSLKEKKEFLDSFDAVFFDCDGVIWLLTEPIPHTGESVMLLKAAGKQCKFVSNNSMRTDEDYITKLNGIGVKGVKNSDLVHPVKTITNYLKREKPGQKVFSICSTMMNEQFVKLGIEPLTTEPCTSLKNEDLVSAIKTTEEVCAVITDLNFNISYLDLAIAQQYLMKENCSLIAGAVDKFVPIGKDLVAIASEGFINLLRDSTGKEPIMLGKPGHLLGEYLIELFNITDTKRVLFIGDSLLTDIQFGLDNGFQTLLVLSGATKMEQMLKLPEVLKPDYMADGLADFIQFFQMLK